MMNSDVTSSLPTTWLFLSGVQGSGKSSLAEPLQECYLNQQFSCSKIEGDKHHSLKAIQTMQAGRGVEELGDHYRSQWLQSILGACRNEQLRGNHVICSCSLLTEELRKQALRYASDFETPAMILWIDVPETELRHRLQSRRDHFAPAAMLDKQLASLEMPTDSEGPDVVVINGDSDMATVALRAWHAIEQVQFLDG